MTRSYNDRLELLVQIRDNNLKVDSNLKVLSLRRCLKSPRPGMSIVFSIKLYDNDVMDSNVWATKQHFNACYIASGGQHPECPIMLILTLTWHQHSLLR